MCFRPGRKNVRGDFFMTLRRSRLGSLSEGVFFAEWYGTRFCIANCRGRQLGDPSGEAAHLQMEQSRTLNGISPRNCPLASPGGKLDFLTSGTSEPIGKKA